MERATALLFFMNNHPAWLFACLVVVLTAVAIFVRSTGPRLLTKLIAPLAALAIGVHAVFAFNYLNFPAYLDHIEPNAAIVSWLFLKGEPVYHTVDAATRYSFLYGPLGYIINAVTLGLFGGSDFTFKLTGILALLVSYGAILAAALRTHCDRVFTVLASLTYFAAMALFFKNYSFWSKPDSIMTALVALSVLVCTLRSGTPALIAGGAIAGAIINTKLHGAAYVFPMLVFQLNVILKQEGFAAALKSAAIMAAAFFLVAAAPFVLFDNISITNYSAWLQTAGAHGLSKQLLISNAQLLLFAAVPILIWVCAGLTNGNTRDTFKSYWPTVAAVFVSLAVILIVAAKPGSGPHHLLPLLPAIAIIGSIGVRQHLGSGIQPAVWVTAAAFLIAVTIKALVTGSYLIAILGDPVAASAMKNDLNNIIAEHPDKKIHMGYGSTNTYPATFVRSNLVFNGQPYLIDASALMDMQYGGVGIPASTIAAINEEAAPLWLIPKGEMPFTMQNWYYRDLPENDSESWLFEQRFRDNFNDRFEKTASSAQFDLYTRRR